MIELPDFDRLYAADRDPWKVGSSFYERRKRAMLLAALSQETYVHAWDPACGTGHLALALAERCDRVSATDASPMAVGLTADMCADVRRVEVSGGRLPDVGPPGGSRPDADLIVLAEFLYYLDAVQRRDSVALVCDALGVEGEIAAVHWRHHPHDAYLSGADVQAELDRDLTQRGWQSVVRVDDPDFALATWRRPPCGEPEGERS